MSKMTPIEFNVYLAAYVANQPRPGMHDGYDHSQRDGMQIAKHWAACAVFGLRGSVMPTYGETDALFDEFKEANQRQREQQVKACQHVRHFATCVKCGDVDPNEV